MPSPCIQRENWEFETDTLKQALLRDADVDLAKERIRLTELAERQRKVLTTDPVDVSNAGVPIGASQRAIELKERRHRLNADLASLRVQQKPQPDNYRPRLTNRPYFRPSLRRFPCLIPPCGPLLLGPRPAAGGLAGRPRAFSSSTPKHLLETTNPVSDWKILNALALG